MWVRMLQETQWTQMLLRVGSKRPSRHQGFDCCVLHVSRPIFMCMTNQCEPSDQGRWLATALLSASRLGLAGGATRVAGRQAGRQAGSTCCESKRACA
jgi:hypothetical protein